MKTRRSGYCLKESIPHRSDLPMTFYHCLLLCPGDQIFGEADQGQYQKGIGRGGDCPISVGHWGAHPPPVKHWDPPRQNDFPQQTQHGHEIHLLRWQVRGSAVANRISKNFTCNGRLIISYRVKQGLVLKLEIHSDFSTIHFSCLWISRKTQLFEKTRQLYSVFSFVQMTK